MTAYDQNVSEFDGTPPSATCGVTKRLYKTPSLSFNGKLESVTLQYAFGADGVCAPGGQGFDDTAPNYDPDCTGM